jgi:predicted branched-subunit amino acid permease
VSDSSSDRPAAAETQYRPYGSGARAFRGGAIDALGLPALVLGASYLGFGSLVRESGYSLTLGLFSTMTGWALPGQVVLIELMALGSSLFAICLAVAMTNMRLLPMAVTLTPMLRVPGRPGWRYYLAAHFCAVTVWVFTMRRAPSLPMEERLSYFLGFAVTIWGASMVGTATGYLLSATVPMQVSLGLVFLNPIYFMLMFMGDLGQRSRVLALLIGLAAGPLLFQVDADWGLMIAGLGAGTLGFYLDRWLPRKGSGKGGSGGSHG